MAPTGGPTGSGFALTDVDRHKPGVVWFRRDLRLDDNPAWAAATATHAEVIALFVIEPKLFAAASDRRCDYLLSHLSALDDRLRSLGGALTVRPGPASQAVPDAVVDCDAAAVYLNADSSRFSVTRDAAVRRALKVPVLAFPGLTVHEPGKILTKGGRLSQVFAPFYRTWAATELTPWPAAGTGKPVEVDDYPETRDLPGVAGTSALSVDLKFGSLAARTVLDIVGTATPGRAAFVRQLAWRDWWAHLLAERPDLPDVALRSGYGAIAWRADPGGFERWCDGQTGYPIVDAGMRQLTSTGWMHNRVRMICASFLVKDLLIDWRRGECFFRHHLVDGDVAQNAGNWQWVAGTGPDAAPYFRVFNPTTQGKKFDPNGTYTRRWVPELASLPAPAIHEPASLGPLELAAAGVTLGQSYPAPIVVRREARARALAAYKTALA